MAGVIGLRGTNRFAGFDVPVGFFVVPATPVLLVTVGVLDRAAVAVATVSGTRTPNF